jgi:hypothetical protein
MEEQTDTYPDDPENQEKIRRTLRADLRILR